MYERAFRNYDQWKTASPYDNEPDESVCCPRCGDMFEKDIYGELMPCQRTSCQEDDEDIFESTYDDPNDVLLDGRD